jgi:nitrate reductase NapAB chaperone NapD
MNVSGILVVADTEQLDAVLAQLTAIEGVEVRQFDRASGRIVVVQEAPDTGAEVAGFSRIRALPHVLAADLVCHYFGDEPVVAPQVESALAFLAAPAAPPRRPEEPAADTTVATNTIEQPRGTP